MRMGTETARRGSGHRSKLLLAAAVVVGVMGANGSTALAQDATWDGDTSADWGTLANWTGAGIPGSNGTGVGTAFFTNTTPNNAVTVGTGGPGTGGAYKLGILRFNGTTASFTIGNAVGDGTLQSGNSDDSLIVDATVTASQIINSNFLLDRPTNHVFRNNATGGTLSLNGNFSDANVNASVIALQGSGTGVINGSISSGLAPTLNVTISNAGSWTFNGNNTHLGTATSAIDGISYNRNITLSGAGATLAIGNDNGAGASAGYIGLSANGTLRASGGSRTLANGLLVSATSAIGGSDNLTINGKTVFTGTSTLSVNNTALTTLGGEVQGRNTSGNRVAAFAGTGRLNISGPIVNSDATTVATNAYTLVTYAGSSTLRSTGNNTYSGTTAITGGGTYLVNGTHKPTALSITQPSSNYSIGTAAATAGTLGGTGTIGDSAGLKPAVTIQALGTLAPGDSTLAPAAQTGTLNIAGNITFNTGSTFTVQLGGATPGDGQGFYDQLLVDGSVTLTPNVNFGASLVNGYLPTVGSAFYVLAAGTVPTTNTFAGLTEGASIALGDGVVASITYQANWAGTQLGSTLVGGNDIALVITESPAAAVPEPASLALLAMLSGACLARRRRN